MNVVNVMNYVLRHHVVMVCYCRRYSPVIWSEAT